MRWIEVTIPCESGKCDELCARLAELGIDGMSIEDEQDFRSFLQNNRRYWDYVDENLERRFEGLSRVKLYLADDEGGRATLEMLRRELHTEPQTGYVDDEDWENGWKKYYEPLEIGSKLLIVPEWLTAEADGRVQLRLDPGLAFGTGSHATTQLCLEAVQEMATEGARVLDLGCGSGILGLAALILGAAECVGVDVDPKSPDAARANAELNGIGSERLRLYAGDVAADAGLRRTLGGGYGIVFANIVADVIIALAPYARMFMAEGGRFICSGIIDYREAETASALERAGLKIERRLAKDEWRCFVCA